MRTFLLTFFTILATISVSAQDELNFQYEGYTFTTTSDTANYCTVLNVSKNCSNIFKSECGDRVLSIVAEDLDNNGKKELLMEQYTGGAHCCSYVVAFRMVNDRISVLDTLWWRDSGYEIKDLDNDGTKELTGYDAVFAYAFTNFAQSYFPVIIIKFKNDKFYDATKQFPGEVEKDIKSLKEALKEYTDKGFDCPKSGDDTFNTDAGAVKAILAPLVYDYSNLNKMQAGYDYVKKIYKCNDAVNFISILQKDFKLK